MKPVQLATFRGWPAIVWVCVLLGFLQVYLVFYPDPLLIVWPDSFGFIGPGIDAVERGNFSFWGSSGGYVYQLMLWGLLTISPDPWLIVMVQRVMLVVTYCLLATASCLVLHGIRRKGLISSWLGTFAVSGWLLGFVLYPGTVGTAHTLMTETLFSFLVTALVLSMTLVATDDASPRWRVAAAGVAGFLDVALMLTRSHWMLAAIATPVVVPFLCARPRRWAIVRGVIAGLAIGIATLGVANFFWERQDPGRLRVVFGPRSLFCNNADLIYGQWGRSQDEFSEAVRQSLGRMLTPEARHEAAQHGWQRVGFDGDVCTYGETVKIISSHFTGRPSDEASFYLRAYGRAALAQPSYVASRVWRQFGEIDPFPLVLADSFQGDLGWATTTIRGLRTMFDTWASTYPGIFVGKIDPPTMRSNALRRIHVVHGRQAVWGSVFAGFLVVTLRRSWRNLPSHERLFAAVTICWLALNVLISVVHLNGGRYLIMQTPLSVFVSLTGTLAVLARLMTLAAPARVPQQG